MSVVIPARDEAASIRGLVCSVPDGVEVVVVDDHSGDTTAIEAASAGARVIAAEPLPEGWTGKAWACEQGVAAATRDTIVFVDADVRFGADGLDAAVAAHDRHGGLVSVQPFHEPGRPAEALASIFNIVAFGATDAASPLGRWRGARGAFGPVLVTDRADHAAVGGHRAVRASVVDDVALAGRYRERGLPVTIFAGAGLIAFRMYPDGFGQLVEGFTKNMASGVEAVRRTTTAVVVAWLTLLVQAAAAPLVALLTGDGGLAAIALYAGVALQLWWMGRRLGRFGPLVALAFPVSVVVFLAVFVRSVWATRTGSVSWRGRRILTRPPGGTRR